VSIDGSDGREKPNVPGTPISDDPEYSRKRAEEARTLPITDAHTKSLMLVSEQATTCTPLQDLLYFVVGLAPGEQEMDNADPPVRLGNSLAPLV
jgi:hypothetical protein